MNYATIKPVDIANGPGVRVSLFVSGCRHHCRGCFNAQAWDFEYGEPFTGSGSRFSPIWIMTIWRELPCLEGSLWSRKTRLDFCRF